MRLSVFSCLKHKRLSPQSETKRQLAYVCRRAPANVRRPQLSLLGVAHRTAPAAAAAAAAEASAVWSVVAFHFQCSIKQKPVLVLPTPYSRTIRASGLGQTQQLMRHDGHGPSNPDGDYGR